ncbi:MAG: pilus assembly PilX N-terminal domain-containing protein [Desulfatiglandaceae bacterium]
MRESEAGRDREQGSVMVIALVVLALLTIIGIAASQLSESELGMAANWRLQKEAFYAAESAGGYVTRSPNLYDNENMSGSAPKTFSSPGGVLGPGQSFDGTVQYLGASAAPRGSGFEVGAFKAHRYKMICNGHGPSGARRSLEIGFYRLGF